MQGSNHPALLPDNGENWYIQIALFKRIQHSRWNGYFMSRQMRLACSTITSHPGLQRYRWRWTAKRTTYCYGRTCSLSTSSTAMSLLPLYKLRCVPARPSNYWNSTQPCHEIFLHLLLCRAQHVSLANIDLLSLLHRHK